MAGLRSTRFNRNDIRLGRILTMLVEVIEKISPEEYANIRENVPTLRECTLFQSVFSEQRAKSLDRKKENVEKVPMGRMRVERELKLNRAVISLELSSLI